MHPDAAEPPPPDPRFRANLDVKTTVVLARAAALLKRAPGITNEVN